jgi:hypothetical protein
MLWNPHARQRHDCPRGYRDLGPYGLHREHLQLLLAAYYLCLRFQPYSPTSRGPGLQPGSAMRSADRLSSRMHSSQSMVPIAACHSMNVARGSSPNKQERELQVCHNASGSADVVARRPVLVAWLMVATHIGKFIHHLGTTPPCRSNTMPNTRITSPSRDIGSRTGRSMTLH